jgi:cell fate (sporulation/competence/biofilm development) regulator YmcA (YheA/YmcA/DUF963 family)
MSELPEIERVNGFGKPASDGAFVRHYDHLKALTQQEERIKELEEELKAEELHEAEARHSFRDQRERADEAEAQLAKQEEALKTVIADLHEHAGEAVAEGLQQRKNGIVYARELLEAALTTPVQDEVGERPTIDDWIDGAERARVHLEDGKFGEAHALLENLRRDREIAEVASEEQGEGGDDAR